MTMTTHPFLFLAATCAALLAALRPVHAEAPLRVAISPDIAPYVTDSATGGFEVALMHALLPGRTLTFVQHPYAALQTAVPRGEADIAVGVQPGDDGAWYSGPVIAFVNYAISRKSDTLPVATVSDLAPYPLLTWQNAYRELGPAFEQAYAPGTGLHARLVEIADQSEQVRRFWAVPKQIVVIDGSIFEHLSHQQGQDPGEAEFHALFPPTTDFRVAFRDPVQRDEFDRNLIELCQRGAYQALRDRYGIPVGGICPR
ncbi:MAG: amino acid ABC transporter [Gammaproteobacteria bacterium]|nr:amino acid ABC transporter [Gammaproteobacteria bacterium]MCP5138133.1 amino acid ABC transporter [Gammaproteobacteria bacterium]